MKKKVMTGQQIGLLGGPLYTTYKVLGAIHYARAIGGSPVYWLETNDADFEEINHLDYLDADGELRSLSWKIDSQGFSCGLIEIDDSLIAMLEKFFATLRQTEFTPALRELALRCYVPGRALGQASCHLASELFGRFGIELFDPSTPLFKTFIKKLLRAEAERTSPGEQCNLFCMIEKKTDGGLSRRARIFLRDGARVNFDDYDLAPNVKTRPVCQDAYFDTHAYIAGPGEVKYLQELDALYEYHGVKQAQVIPRMSVTLLEPRALRLLKKHGLSVNDVLELPRPALIKHALKTVTGFDEKDLSVKARQLTQDFFDGLDQLGIHIRKTTEKTIQQAIKENLGEQRAREKASSEQILKSAGVLSDLLSPFGKRQERVFNLFYYMNLYGGLALIDWLYERYNSALKTLEITG